MLKKLLKKQRKFPLFRSKKNLKFVQIISSSHNVINKHFQIDTSFFCVFKLNSFVNCSCKVPSIYQQEWEIQKCNSFATKNLSSKLFIKGTRTPTRYVAINLLLHKHKGSFFFIRCLDKIKKNKKSRETSIHKSFLSNAFNQ